METYSRVRSAAEVLDVFQPPVTEFDDNESDSEDEDYVETDSVQESEVDAESDAERMEVEGGGSGGVVASTQRAGAAQPSEKSRVRRRYLCSKSGFVWLREAPDFRCRPSQMHYIACPKGQALNVTTPLEAWSLLFSDEILNIIVRRTNEEIARTFMKITENGGRVESYKKLLDLAELKALIGLLYFAGVKKLSDTNTRSLWSPYGMSLFRLTMPENRFVFLLVSMRFDEKNTRCERKAHDRLANIREIWNMFIANCTANYEPNTNCTVGEQFLPFRGRCLFRTYTPAKLDRYGLKIFSLIDATTHYMYNAIPYVGNVNEIPDDAGPSYYVKKLSEPIYYTGRTITSGNWFTSITICQDMKNYSLTMVGTLRKNTPEIPEEFKKMPPAGTNVQFGYNDKRTLVSFNPKEKKILLLLSSLPFECEIDEAKGKPEIVLFHNRTKSATESFNQKCHEYSTARKTRRWPMRYFYGMLDQANVNSLILYSSCKHNLKMKRTDFILDLSTALVKPFLSSRLTSSTLRTTLRVQIEAFLDYKNIPEDQDSRDLTADNKMEKQKRCSYCPLALDRKSYYKCLKCERPMCKKHVAKVCCFCSINMSK